MPDLETDDFGLTPKSKQLLREEAARLALLGEKLSEALAVAKTLEYEPWKDEIPPRIEAQIDEIQSIYSRSMFMRALQEQPAWFVRIKTTLLSDKYLLFSTLVTGLLLAGFATLLTSEVLAALKNLLGQLFSWPRPARAAEGAALSINAKEGIRYALLGIIAMGFFVALGIMGFSSKADARKFSADMIKTILGFFVGMATKLID